ncbi:MAG: hypothetical protein DME31_00570 [Verrucomicrobia bacterium]|nr:MAG: hypothetical protein DME31_00570 [Verrucomicrobiota bacterium]
MIAGAAVSFCARALARLSPDSARTKNTTANTVASQKIGRTAFDLVILLLLFCAPAFRNFVYTQIKPRLTHRGSTPGILRRRFQKRQAESSARKATEAAIFTRKGNRIVT